MKTQVAFPLFGTEAPATSASFQEEAKVHLHRPSRVSTCLEHLLHILQPTVTVTPRVSNLRHVLQPPTPWRSSCYGLQCRCHHPCPRVLLPPHAPHTQRKNIFNGARIPDSGAQNSTIATVICLVEGKGDGLSKSSPLTCSDANIARTFASSTADKEDQPRRHPAALHRWPCAHKTPCCEASNGGCHQ